MNQPINRVKQLLGESAIYGLGTVISRFIGIIRLPMSDGPVYVCITLLWYFKNILFLDRSAASASRAGYLGATCGSLGGFGEAHGGEACG